MRWISIILICVFALSCKKWKITCDTDEECEQDLVGGWQDASFSTNPHSGYEFRSDGTYTSRHWDSGKEEWEPCPLCSDTLEYKDYIKNIKGVKATDVKRVAKKYFGNKYTVVSIEQK